MNVSYPFFAPEELYCHAFRLYTMKNKIQKTFSLLILMLPFILNACTPLAASTPTLPATTESPASTVTQIPTSSPTPTEPDAGWKSYTNSDFGLEFQYPSTWFGPEAYVSDETLRVEIGSDKVYPYGTDRSEQIYKTNNSYYVRIQYTKNNQNTYSDETLQSLAKLKNGESLADARSLLIRVRQLNLGRFKGFETISTLSETAQTEPVYIREVILIDEQSNRLTISGYPNNVEIGSGAAWRDEYQQIDEANLTIFHEIVDSLTVE